MSNIDVIAFVRSLPTRERGLKCHIGFMSVLPFKVAPYAGAWIEILLPSTELTEFVGRSLRGSVD